MSASLNADAQSLLARCRAYLVDLDGTIYLDDELLPGAQEFLSQLSRLGAKHLFLTNNSSKSWRHYQERLSYLGIKTEREDILTSGTATIDYLLNETPHRKVYLIGTEGLARDVEEAGLILSDTDPDCVMVGFDTTVDYAKLEKACTFLFAGKDYVATHPDRTCITQRGLVPDIAAIIAACEAVTRRLPKIIGKPFPEMVNAALGRMKSTASETAMIGDQLDTDMQMAKDSGLCSVLLMSGETSEQKLAAVEPANRPKIIADNIRVVARGLAEVETLC